MATHEIIGPNGAEVTVDVPGPGLDQETFDRRVESGEFTVKGRKAKGKKDS